MRPVGRTDQGICVVYVGNSERGEYVRFEEVFTKHNAMSHVILKLSKGIPDS